MTPNARRVVERRNQRQAQVWARLDAERAEELRNNPRPQWQPPTSEREYQRDEDGRQVNPGEQD